MAGREPVSGKAGGKPTTVLCAEWEALLVDALDGTLSANEAAAFETHRESCLACAQLLEEAKRGGEWLQFLQAEPDVPEDLVSRILASTSGTSELIPAALPVIAGAPAVVSYGWLPGLERHAMQSRWIMTAAMAFFSIAFTLNAAGVRLNGFHLSDLKPTAIASSVVSQIHFADRQVVRYYDNLRFVYELESRVREMRRDAVPADVQTVQPSSKPVSDGTEQPKPKKATGGSAQKSVPAGNKLPSAGHPQQETTGEPVMASLQLQSYDRVHLTSVVCTPAVCPGSAVQPLGVKPFLRVEKRTGKQGTGRTKPGTADSTTISRTERSLA